MASEHRFSIVDSPFDVTARDDRHRDRHDHDHHDPDHHDPDHHDHDHHGHDHHGHGGHGHHHAPASFGAAFAIGAALNIGFVVIEGVFGWLAGSMALLADAGHNLGDVLALLAAWGAHGLTRVKPSARYTYGLRSTTSLAALFNAVLLVLITGGVAWEALRRLADPQPVQSLTVILVAATGIVINGATAALFARGREGDLNIRSAFAHMLADALVSLGVVAAGLVILFTGWTWLDPLASLVISGLIVFGSWNLLRESFNLVLHAAPAHVETTAVASALRALPGVAAIHDLHVWPLSTTETALTCHLVMPEGMPSDAFLAETSAMLETRFRIGHATLQIERDLSFDCPLAPDHVV
jgi:cobalt-zinc-cadmium efflux system protein